MHHRMVLWCTLILQACQTPPETASSILSIPNCAVCSVLSPPQLASLGDWRAVESSAAVESQSRRPQSPLFLRAFRAQGCKVRRWEHAAHLQPQLALASGEEMSIAMHCHALLCNSCYALLHLLWKEALGTPCIWPRTWAKFSQSSTCNQSYTNRHSLLLTWSSLHGRVQHSVTCRRWMLFKRSSAIAPPNNDATITPMPTSHQWPHAVKCSAGCGATALTARKKWKPLKFERYWKSIPKQSLDFEVKVFQNLPTSSDDKHR